MTSKGHFQPKALYGSKQKLPSLASVTVGLGEGWCLPPPASAHLSEVRAVSTKSGTDHMGFSGGAREVGHGSAI